jgi:hypothetical protein
MNALTATAYDTTTAARFHELDDYVLRLKGLVLVRRLREKVGADRDELVTFDDEIERARTELADFVRNGAP